MVGPSRDPRRYMGEEQLIPALNRGKAIERSQIDT
jgi:hypothetical protein